MRGEVVKIKSATAIGAIFLLVAAGVFAQNTGPRDLAELKQETQRRADRNLPPIGGVKAILAARRMMRGRSWMRVTSTAHFTSGWAIGTKGSYSNGSCSPYPISYWPAVMINGEPENLAL